MMAIEKVAHRPLPYRLEIDWGDSRYCSVSYRKAYFAGKQGIRTGPKEPMRGRWGTYDLWRVGSGETA